MMWIFLAITVLISAVSAGLLLYITKKEKYTSKQDVPLKLDKIVIIYSVICIIVNVVFALFLYKNNVRDIAYFCKTMALLGVLWPVAYIDFKVYRIPNIFIIFGFSMRALILIYEIIFEQNTLKKSIVSDVVAAAVIVAVSFLCLLILKNSIGAGDIKLFAVLGIFLGLNGIFSAIFFSLIASFIIACFALISKKKSRKDAIPFGPAIAIGTYISVFLTYF